MESYSKDLVEALKGIVFDCNWQNVGNISQFEPMKCYKLYSLDEIDEDILLIRDQKDQFYAIESRCSHEGGPLEDGDIEELGEKLLIICPWHSFDFDLKNGESSVGLKQQVFATRVVNNDLYINTPTSLSLSKKSNNELKLEADSEKNSVCGSTTESEDLDENSLTFWAVKILNTSDPHEKANLTNTVAEKWFKNEIKQIGKIKPPEQPSRPDNLNIIDPGKIKRGKGGTLASRVALLHSLANIEQWAMDLSWDIISRFAAVQFPDNSTLPSEFFSDFVKVAQDEAKHFVLLEKRLKELNSYFGALPVHNGLWESATVTKSNFLSRLSIVHMVHEARGLDVHPQTRLRFLNQNDLESVKLLDILYEDEITHVAAGIKWFQYTCKKHDYDFIKTFQEMVKNYFKGYLKPPFDTHGRNTAGMTEEWYLPLVKPMGEYEKI